MQLQPGDPTPLPPTPLLSAVWGTKHGQTRLTGAMGIARPLLTAVACHVESTDWDGEGLDRENGMGPFGEDAERNSHPQPSSPQG